MHEKRSYAPTRLCGCGGAAIAARTQAIMAACSAASRAVAEAEALASAYTPRCAESAEKAALGGHEMFGA